jgi:heme exporter protein B
MLFSQVKYLVQKEIKMEWRQKYAFNSIILYIVSTIFICFLSFKNVVNPFTWNALFWIILLFASISAISKSFVQESKGLHLYYYSLVSAESIIFSKLIYNSLLMLVLSVLCFLAYSLFIGNIVQDIPMFLLILILGSVGFSSILTLIAAIASRTGGNSTLMAILGFPLTLPLLITVLKASKNAIDGLDRSVNNDYILLLLLLNVIAISLSFILFPYLWRD